MVGACLWPHLLVSSCSSCLDDSVEAISQAESSPHLPLPRDTFRDFTIRHVSVDPCCHMRDSVAHCKSYLGLCGHLKYLLRLLCRCVPQSAAAPG